MKKMAGQSDTYFKKSKGSARVDHHNHVMGV